MRLKPRPVRHAFTLVELLVVIGIIAILIGILLPALSRARQQSQSTQCLSNLHQIVTACINYSQDFQGAMIPVDYTDASTGKTIWWPGILTTKGYLVAPRIDPSVVSTAGPLNARSVFYCPSGLTDAQFLGGLGNNATVPASRIDAEGQRPYREVDEDGYGIDFWYGINGGTDTPSANWDPNTQGPPAHHHITPPFKSFPKMTVVHRAADMVFFFDGLLDGAVGDKAVNPSRVNARHMNNTMTNLAFFDGHCVSYRAADLPGGINPTLAEVKDANLIANYPPPNPQWVLEQQDQ